MSRLIKWGVKFGIVGATVSYTQSSGVWGDSSITETLYKDIHLALEPLVLDAPVEIPELPKASDVSRAMVNGWNSGVFHSAMFIAHLPTHAVNAFVTSKNYIDELTNAPSP